MKLNSTKKDAAKFEKPQLCPKCPCLTLLETYVHSELDQHLIAETVFSSS